jgi:hypothetical protein
VNSRHTTNFNSRADRIVNLRVSIPDRVSLF